MLKTRLIPCLLLKDGRLVRSERFRFHQVIGDPWHEVRRFNEWAVDELVYLDITRDPPPEGGAAILDVLERVAERCFVPLTFGGGIRSPDDVHARIARGADKVTLNTGAFDDHDLVRAAVRRFGSQAVVVSIDVLRHPDGRLEVHVDHGRRPTGADPVEWAREAAALGAGEILLNSIDRDGTGEGYDLDLVRAVAEAVAIPVIACGGVGRYEDFAPAVRDGGASAVAAANIFHFKELSDRNAKRALSRAGIDVRT